MFVDRRLFLVVSAGCLFWLSNVCRAEFFQQTNLVSSVPGLANFTDPNLKNPWGISSSAASPVWVSDQVTGKATLYNGLGQPQPTATPLVVTIPGSPTGAPSGPTGQVFNNTAADFVLTTGGRATFMFATLNGTITGWNPAHGTNAEVAASTPGAVYTGLAIGNNGTSNFLYAANAAANKIDVFNSTFGSATLSGNFTDPNLPAGFTVYNIQQLQGTLFVTYENETAGGGVVDAFDLNGNFLRRVSSNADGGPLDSPWGLAIAPSTFGQFGGALLVGNEDDGHISAFDPTTGQFLGQLIGVDGLPIANTGLWGLKFGNGGALSNPNFLYFAAGIQGETQGLFGSLRAVPEPASAVLVVLGALSLFVGYRRRSRPPRVAAA